MLAFSNGIEINDTTVFFGKMRFEHLENAIKSMKSLLNRRKKDNLKNNKMKKIHSLFPRNLDDKANNLGGLFQSSHQCMIPISEIFHSQWSQSNLAIFPFSTKTEPIQIEMETETEMKIEKKQGFFSFKIVPPSN